MRGSSIIFEKCYISIHILIQITTIKKMIRICESILLLFYGIL